MKRSIVISILAFTILFCSAIGSFAATGKVTTDTLRLRQEASADATVIALLSLDDKVEILEEKDGWYKIKSGETIGYVSADYVSIDAETLTPETEKAEEEKNNTEETTSEIQEDIQNENTKTKPTIKIIPSEVKIYITPVLNSMVLSTVAGETKIDIASEVNGWAYVTSENLKGWVRTENIIEKEVSEAEINNNENNNTENNNSSQKSGFIIGNTVNFREEANTSANVIAKLKKNTEVKVIEKDNEWAKVEYNGKVGYVAVQYISDKKVETTTRSAAKPVNTQTQVQTQNNTQEHTQIANAPEETTNVAETNTVATAENNTANNANVENTTTNTTDSTTTNTNVAETNSNETTVADIIKTPVETATSQSSVTGADIVAYARKYLGCKYVYGGTTPSGFDCSGYTQYVYKHFGYSLSRSSSAQSSNGRAVGKADMQPGDIICFSNSSKSKSIGHVGIYIGGGQFIHAANSRKGVIISNVDGAGFYYVCSRRII